MGDAVCFLPSVAIYSPYIICMYESNQMNQMIECFEDFDLEEKEYLVDVFTKD